MKLFTFTDALIMAISTHQDKKDLGGTDYIKHPLHIYHEVKMNGGDEDTQVTAILHDVIEDGAIIIENLKYSNCQESVLEALKLLTHVVDYDFINNQIIDKYNTLSKRAAKKRAEEDEYLNYIHSLSSNYIAKAVKIEDLKHNMDINRLGGNIKLKEKDVLRRLKYKKALEILNGDRV